VIEEHFPDRQAGFDPEPAPFGVANVVERGADLDDQPGVQEGMLLRCRVATLFEQPLLVREVRARLASAELWK